MPLHQHSTEATYSASRTRKAPPTQRQLDAATEVYRGCYLWRRNLTRGQKWDVWFPMFAETPGVDPWDWCFNASTARLCIDRRLDAHERLAQSRAEQQAEEQERAAEAAYWAEQDRREEYAGWIEAQANAEAVEAGFDDREPAGYEPSWERSR